MSYGAKNTHNKSDYGSYNFLGSGRIDGTTNQATAEKTLNTWTLKMCTDMKKQGIELYTVVYKEMAASVHNLFKSCASKPSNFHLASDTSALDAAISKIGNEIAGLRLTQ